MTAHASRNALRLILYVALAAALFIVVRGELRSRTSQSLLDARLEITRVFGTNFHGYGGPGRVPYRSKNAAFQLETASRLVPGPEDRPDWVFGVWRTRFPELWELETQTSRCTDINLVQHRIDAELQASQVALALAERTADLKESSYRVQYYLGYDAGIPPLLEIHALAVLSYLRAAQALCQEDFEQAELSAKVIHRVRESFRAEAGLYFERYAFFSEVLQMRLLALALAEPSVSVSTVEALAGYVEPLAPKERWQKALGHDAMLLARYMRTHLARGQGHEEDTEPMLTAAIQEYLTLGRALDDVDSFREAATRFRLPEEIRLLSPNMHRAGHRTARMIAVANTLTAATQVKFEGLSSGTLAPSLKSPPQNPWTKEPIRYQRATLDFATLSIPGAKEAYNEFESPKRRSNEMGSSRMSDDLAAVRSAATNTGAQSLFDIEVRIPGPEV